MEPDVLLEWIGTPGLQMDAINALNMELLLADNVDTVFQKLPPRSFLPVICKIFLDASAEIDLIEAAMRAVTHYLDVHVDCARRVSSVEGAVPAICSRLEATDFGNFSSRDLATQTVKVLAFLSEREADAVHAAGALQACLAYIITGGEMVYMDGRLSAMSVISRCCSRLDPTDAMASKCIERLSGLLDTLLSSSKDAADPRILQGTLKCFSSLAERFSRKRADLSMLASCGLPNQLVQLLKQASAQDSSGSGGGGTVTAQMVVQLLPNLCRNSAEITKTLLAGQFPIVVENALLGDEQLATSTLQLVELLLVILFDGREAVPNPGGGGGVLGYRSRPNVDGGGIGDHALIELIRQKDYPALCEAVDSGVDPSHTDKMGQTLLNWASAFGTADMVEYLCDSGADVNSGRRSTSLHYAACYGRVRITQLLLEYGADHTLVAEDGKTALELAKEKDSNGSHSEVVRVLETPDRWMQPGEDEDEEELAEDEMVMPGLMPIVRTGSGHMHIGSTAPKVKASKPAAASARGGGDGGGGGGAASAVPEEDETAAAAAEEVAVEQDEDPKTRMERAAMYGCKPKGDAETASLFVARLVPSLLRAFKAAMHDTLKTRLLETVSKMIKYATPEMLRSLFDGNATVDECEAAAAAAAAKEEAAAAAAAAAAEAAAVEYEDEDMSGMDPMEAAELRAALAMSMSDEPLAEPAPSVDTVGAASAASAPGSPLPQEPTLMPPFPAKLLMEPLPGILNAAEIEAGHNHVLCIVEYLTNKVPDEVKAHLARVGILSRVTALAKQGKGEVEKRAKLEAENLANWRVVEAAAAAEEAARQEALALLKAAKTAEAEAAAAVEGEASAATEAAAAATAEGASPPVDAPAPAPDASPAPSVVLDASPDAAPALGSPSAAAPAPPPPPVPSPPVPAPDAAPGPGVYRCLYEGGVALRAEPSQTADRTSGLSAPRYKEERVALGSVDGAEGIKYLEWRLGQYSAFCDPHDPSHKFFEYVGPIPPNGEEPASYYEKAAAALQVWEVEGDDGWIPYDSHTNDRIIDGIMRGRGEVSIGGSRILRFRDKKQINQDTGKERTVRAKLAIEVGMKLEAVDRKNPSLVCVATVQDYSPKKKEPLLIHFDGWSSMYDFWTKPDSADLHPIGYCARQGIELQAPKSHSGSFSWTEYMEMTQSKAIPKRMLTGTGAGISATTARTKKKLPSRPTLPSLSVGERVRKLAYELHTNHFAGPQSMRAAVLELKDVGAQLKALVPSTSHHRTSTSSPDSEPTNPAVSTRPGSVETEARKLQIKAVLGQLCRCLQSANISPYEFQSIGLAEALLAFLSETTATGSSNVARRSDFHLRLEMFRSAFSKRADGTNPAQELVRMLVDVLQHVESLPVLVHDSPGSGHGLGVLLKSLRFKLRRHEDEEDMVNLSGRSFRMEPLASVRTLEKYLLKKVTRPWYDYSRSTIKYIERLDAGARPVFQHRSDFDKNGIMHWIGTNGATETEWANPSKAGLVCITFSSSDPSDLTRFDQSLPFGTVHDVLSRETSPKNCHTNDVAGSWMAMDMGVYVIPTAYTLRHARGYTRSALRHWTFDASVGGKEWTTLKTHVGDAGLEETGSTHTWTLESPAGAKGWRHIRIKQTGKNAGGSSHYLSLSGFEIYGTIVGAADAVGPSRATSTPMDVVPPPPSSSGGGGGSSSGLFGARPTFARAAPAPSFAATPSWAPSGDRGRGAPRPGGGRRGSGSGRGGGRGRGRGYPGGSLFSAFGGGPPLPSDMPGLGLPAGVAVDADEMDEEELDLEDLDDFGDDDGLAEHLARMAAVDPERYRSMAEALRRQPPPPSDHRRYGGGGGARGWGDPRSSGGRPVPREGSWDDGKVLQREFSAMVPPFDPRPERTNVDPLVELAIPPPGSPQHALHQMAAHGGSEHDDMPKLALFLVDKNSDTGQESLQLLSPNMTIFRAVQQLAPLHNAEQGRLSKIWEPTYTIVYRAVRTGDFPAPDYPWDVFFVEEALGTADLQKSEVIRYLQKHGKKEWLKMWKLNGKCKSITKSRNCEQVAAAYRDFVQFFSAQSNAKKGNGDLIRTPAGSPLKSGGSGVPAPTTPAALASATASSEEPVAALLSRLQASKIPASGPINSVHKKQIARCVKAAVANDRSGELVAFLRTAGWNGTGFIADDDWISLQSKAREAVGESYGDDDAEDDDRDDDEPTDLMLKLIRTMHDVAQIGSTSSDGHGDADAHQPEPGADAGAGPEAEVESAATTAAAATTTGFAVSSSDFISQKLNAKLRQQMQDPLVLATRALPSWCEELTTSCPVLFPFETRQLFFSCTAFGVSRTIAWIQKERAAAEQARGGSGASSRNDGRPDSSRSVGRLTSERVFVPRGDKLLDWAVNVMRVHAARKSILEVQFQGEAGYGLGPTLAFYNMVAAELQRKDLCMWICEDEQASVDAVEEEAEVVQGGGSNGADIGAGKTDGGGGAAASVSASSSSSSPVVPLPLSPAKGASGPEDSEAKAPGYYVRQTNGLFPAALPRSIRKHQEVVTHFHFLGTFVAKSLQDERLVALPLSMAMFKLMCGHTLGINDLLEIVPVKAKFLLELQALCSKKREIAVDETLPPAERKAQIAQLTLGPATAPYRLEDVDITFIYQPTSHVYGFPEVTVVDEDGVVITERVHELRPGGLSEIVTLDNAEEYIQLTIDFLLESGIRPQLEAFKKGFEEVFPIEKLAIFTPAEVKGVLCGEQAPEWTMEQLHKYTVPQQGYTHESPGYLQFLESLDSFDVEQRKKFLDFATGCPSLPPGGLANLYPRLTVVPKSSSNDYTYPSVNTCVHYFKMPTYSCTEVAKKRILEATASSGFHLS